jgi:hypothetical protein
LYQWLYLDYVVSNNQSFVMLQKNLLM